MPDWRDQHFGTITTAKPQPKRSGLRGWMVVAFLVPTIAAVVITFFDQVVEVYQRVTAPTPTAVVSPPPDGGSFTDARSTAAMPTVPGELGESPSTGSAEPRTITQQRANELQRVIAQKNQGLRMMKAERAKVEQRLQSAQADLRQARERLIWLEKHRPSHNNGGAVFNWNQAHSDAVAAAKNATIKIETDQRLLTGFDKRITTAQSGLDAAQSELDGAVVIP